MQPRAILDNAIVYVSNKKDREVSNTMYTIRAADVLNSLHYKFHFPSLKFV